jgi:hypothetical protein
MANYDFTTISPPEFEILTRDLLQAKFESHIESFKVGRDQGIDLRYTTTDNGRCIVQCKHYAKSGLPKLLSDLRNKEKSKIDKLQPDRYILCTSVPLSPANKDAIMESLAPHIKHPQDILGKEDLNNLLALYEKIERRHFKLWMSSVSILNQILHASVFNQTEATLEGVRRRLALFVATPSYSRALEKIRDHGTCLIIGAPGVGKSTVAEMVAMRHVAVGWTAISLSAHISEAFEVFAPGTKQIFYYDDFLGQTTGDKLGKNEDSQIVRLMEACGRYREEKRLILTTRDYIFASAKKRYEQFDVNDFDPMTCAVQVNDLTLPMRASLLANHLFFYDVPQETMNQLAHLHVADTIISHRNFSPRVVEMMCRSSLTRSMVAEQFVMEFRKNLDNPMRIWKHAFENHLSNEARSALLALTSMGSEVESSDLELAASALNEALCHHPLPWLDYKNALDVLDGSFVRIKIRTTSERQGNIRSTTESVFISLHNPSIKDFLKGYIKDQGLSRLIFRAARFWPQVIFSLAQTTGSGMGLGMIADEDAERVVRQMFRSRSTEWIHSQGSDSRRFNDNPIQRAQMLIDATASHSQKVRLVALVLLVEALHSVLEEEHSAGVSAVSSLSESWALLSSELKHEFNVNPLAIANWISERISSDEAVEPADYQVALEFFEEHLDAPSADSMTQYLRSDFEAWVLHGDPEYNLTANGLEYFIGEVEETAHALDINVTDQLQHLRDHLDRLKIDEEEHAHDLEQREWEDSGPGKRVDDVSVILGSLKSE